MSGEKSEWFATWFDSPYYHLLYKHRDDEEAHAFLDVLIDHLDIEEQASMLDLGCGKGRYAKYLNSKGFDVLGIDLAANSIAYAKQFENEHLQFRVHDMRHPIEGAKFKYIFNLFTSFGYFRTDEEDMAVLRAVRSVIEDDGTFLIDYLNCNKAIKNLRAEEEAVKDDVSFEIKRWVAEGRIHKQICVKGQVFKEEVVVINLNKFQEYAEATGFTLSNVYGNYQLDPFNQAESDRMIMIYTPI
ncbi:MAG: methyltransferase domain-containing protein [Flavobacteriales bacterium]|nr:methyltransferase domain-containing protein [Flavobacteriales bacterium]